MDYLFVRINPMLKEKFFDFCKKRGLKPGVAVRFFAKQFVESGKIPFSLDNEIEYGDNNSVRANLYFEREERRQFVEACDKYGLPMSIIVRGFMAYCVANNRFPYDENGEERKLDK